MKNKMTYMVLVLVAFLSLFYYSPNTPYACSCAQPGTPQQELDGSSAVFSGKVINIVDKNRTNFIESSADPVAVQLEVKNAWKGINQKQVVVFTERDSASCGYEFDSNKEYLVYASEADGVLKTSYCSRTSQLNMANEDLTVLGKGDQITGEESEGKYQSTVTNSNNAGTIYFVFILVGFAVIVGIYSRFLMKKKHRK